MQKEMNQVKPNEIIGRKIAWINGVDQFKNFHFGTENNTSWIIYADSVAFFPEKGESSFYGADIISIYKMNHSTYSMVTSKGRIRILIPDAEFKLFKLDGLNANDKHDESNNEEIHSYDPDESSDMRLKWSNQAIRETKK